MSPKTSYNEPLWRNERNTQTAVLLILGTLWILLAQGSSQEQEFRWPLLLHSMRFALTLLAFALAIASRFYRSRHLLTLYFLICMGVQSVLAILEGPRRIDYNEYISFFVLLSTLSWNGNFSQWLKRIFPPVVICLLSPFFFKDPIYFSSVGKFVFTFTTPVCLVFLSVIVARINSTKFKAVTENLRLQEELTQEERNKNTALRALNELSAQIAHDIRSPLAALNAAAHETEQLSEEARLLIHGATKRIHAIAEGLLTKQTTKHPSPPEPLSDIVRALVLEKRLQFKDKTQIEIIDRVSPSSCVVEASSVELGRVLSNLIDNAIEADSKPGMRTVTILHADKLREVEIEIRDTGPGIPQEILGKLGLRGATFGKKMGNGLGLFHAKQFAESRGGHLRIQSRLGHGTSIFLSLPRSSSL